MLFSNRWLSSWTGLFLAAVIAGCGGTVSSSSGGGSGGGTSTGGSGGVTSTGGGGAGGATSTGGTSTGGAAQALADQGVAQQDCAPNDGPAVGLHIGTASICNDSANSATQAYFLVYPANLAELTPGLSWDLGGGLDVQFYANGTTGASESSTAAHLEVVSVDAAANTATFSYSFTTMSGAKYAGTATLLGCSGGGFCG